MMRRAKKNAFDNTLLIKLALFNGLGLLIIIIGPLIIDPRLKSHVQFPDRTYSIYCWLWVLVCIPVGIGTYFLGLGYRKTGWQVQILNIIIPTLILIVPGLLISFLLRAERSDMTERPHMGIFAWTVAYGFGMMFTMFFRINRSDFNYLSDHHSPAKGQLESLKATVNFWQQITIYSGAGYLAFVIFLVSVAWTIGEAMISDKKERFFFGNSQVMQIMVYSFFIIVYPLNEAFKTTRHYIEQLSAVEAKDKSK